MMKNSIKMMHIDEHYSAPLSCLIQKEFNALTKTFADIPFESWHIKSIQDNKQLKSPQDIIAYQIGWGNLLLDWYYAGIKNIMPIMPGEGFTTWDYQGLAQHFYTKYASTSPCEQYQIFRQTVINIIAICEKEYKSGNLDNTGVWAWCTLKSGKQWPLSKWVQVNTVAPYKRARSILSTYMKSA